MSEKRLLNRFHKLFVFKVVFFNETLYVVCESITIVLKFELESVNLHRDIIAVATFGDTFTKADRFYKRWCVNFSICGHK